MTGVILQALSLFEQFLTWLRDKRMQVTREKLNADMANAIELARTKKDTSKIDELFNSAIRS